MTIRYGVAESPLGWVFVASTERGVCSVFSLESNDIGPALVRLRQDFPGAELVSDNASARPAIASLMAQLTGDGPHDEVPLDLHGTPFQKRVWEALRAIPRGETRSYGEVAESIGLPGAARAVGTACGANRVWVIVPCHRVVASNGGLGGYYFGLDQKRTLLEMERAAVGVA